MAATIRTARQLAAAGEAPDSTTLPGEVLRFFDFLSTAEKDLQFLMDLCTEHMAALEKQPLVLRRVDSVLEGAQTAFVQVDSVLDGGLEKIRRTKLRKERAQRKFVESAEFRSQEPVVARHHAAILRELVHLRQISLQSPTPSQTTITTTGTTTVSPVEEKDDAWGKETGGSLTKFDNIALLADLMGDAKLSNSTPSPPPKYPFQPVTSSTFPLAELGGSTGHRSDSVSSCPPSELSSVAYGTGTAFEPAELPADHEFVLPPEPVPERGQVYRTHRATISCVTLSPTQSSPDHPNSSDASSLPPPERPEERTRPRSVSQGEPVPPPVPPKIPFSGIFDPHDHEAQPFSPLSDLRPFVQPPPMVEEKQVVLAEDERRVSDLYYLEEKEVVIRQSLRKKSNPRLLLNQADKAGLSLLMGDEPSYSSRHHAAQSSSAVSLVSNTESQSTETYSETFTAPPKPPYQTFTEQPKPPYQAVTEQPKPPSPSFARHTVRSEPSLATISSVSAFSDVSAVSTQESSSTASTSSTMGPVQPLSTIPPELLYGHVANFQAAARRGHSIPRKAVQPRPSVPSIVVQEPTPVNKSSGLRDLFR